MASLDNSNCFVRQPYRILSQSYACTIKIVPIYT